MDPLVTAVTQSTEETVDNALLAAKTMTGPNYWVVPALPRDQLREVLRKHNNPGYLVRSVHLLPKRLDKPEWQHSQDYSSDRKSFPAIDLDGSEFFLE